MSDHNYAGDLHWIRSSPALVRKDAHSIWELSGPWPEPVPDELASFVHEHSRSQRVGDYFETLLTYAILQSKELRLVVTHQQIVENGRTLGEIDFIVEDGHARRTHIEVAIKFFLWFPDVDRRKSHSAKSSGWGSAPNDVHLLGPNPNDSLPGKLSRLQNHQLPMSDHLELEVHEKKIFLLGRIHYPITSDPKHVFRVRETSLSPNHLRGIWMRHSDVPILQQRIRCLEDPFFVLVRKPFWLNEIDRSSLLDLRALENHLANHFMQRNNAVLFCIMDSVGGKLIEVERCFVVDELWPHSHSP